MAGIDELIAQITGQNNMAANAAPAPWQQELLETVNPQKVKRQNIARALAQASTAMATTPGNLLAGISAAAATGADSYITGREQGEDERIKVQQLVQMQQQRDQDRRLSLLMDNLGIQRNQILDKERAEDRILNREDRAEDRKIRQEESDARKSYWERRGTGGEEDGYNSNQTRLIRDSMRKALDDKRKSLLDPDGDPYTQDGLSGADLNAALAEEQARLEAIYDLPLYARPQSPRVQPPAPGAAPGRNITQSDLFAAQGGGEEVQQPAITAPPSGGIRDGATATNPQTGERVIYRNGQWQPL